MGEAVDRALLVVHQADSNPGKVGAMLEARGCVLDRRCPCVGDDLPESLDGYRAVVVFGGPQSANDDGVAGIRAELDWIESTLLPGDVPALGICLGAQQIARVLGARVAPHPEGLVEIGYTEIVPTDAGSGFLDGPTMFYQWHAETFGIPAGAVHLAENDAFASQAFGFEDRVYAIEFHPEMTAEMIDRWCTSGGGAAKLGLRGAQAHAEQLACYRRHAADSDRWLARFVDERLLAAAPAAVGR